MRVRALIPIAAALVSVAAAAPAQAGTLTADGDTVVYRASAGEDNLALLYPANQSGTFNFADGRAATVDVQTGLCVDRGYFGVDCQAGKIRLELGDGTDDIDFGTGFPSTIAAEVYAGDGADRLENGFGDAPDALLVDAGPGNDFVDAREGNQTIRGGIGDDELTGGGGDDVLEGGDGNDLLKPDYYANPYGRDVVDGGSGVDRVEDWSTPEASASHPRTSVTLDGQANDGRPGEGDNVIAVERFDAYVSGDFTLSDGADEVNVYATDDQGASTVLGLGGNDKLTGGNHVETIDGGAGDDVLEGGYNNDTITGGPGRDTIYGDDTSSQCGVLQSCTVPFGNDVINARDGEADVIDCGVGEDRAVVDTVDTVAPNCERVDTGAGPGPAPQPGPNPCGDCGGENPAGALAAKVGSVKLRKALARGLPVTVTAPGAGKVAVTVKKGRKVVAKGSGKTRQAGRVKVTSRFTKAAKKSLRKRRKVALTLTVTYRPVDGGRAQRTTVKRTLR